MSDIDWKDFQIGGKEGVFSIKSSISEIDKKNLNDEVGETPYVTRTDLNNGISMYVTKNQDKKYIPNKGNVISIGLDTQTIFYQPTEFYTGQNIQILSHEKMNEDIARYLIPLLKIQLSKFSWGGNGATLKRLNNSRIMLPINEKDELHWEYMEEQGKALYDRKHNDILKYLRKKQIALKTQLSTTNEHILEEKSWAEFVIEDIVDIKSGVRLTKDDQKEGSTPFIGATEYNNGVTAYVSNINNSLDSNVIGVNYNGAVVESFYHPYKALFSDDVKRIELKNTSYQNKYVYLFLITMIEMQKKKYMYSYKFNAKRMSKQKILLPINSIGNPDWQFMENYMKQIEYEKLTKIIDYLS